MVWGRRRALKKPRAGSLEHGDAVVLGWPSRYFFTGLRHWASARTFPLKPFAPLRLQLTFRKGHREIISYKLQAGKP